MAFAELDRSPELTPVASARPLRQWPAVLLGIAIFSALSAAAAVSSDGFLEADGCVHFEYAKFALREHHLFTNVWGRPFCTAIYCIPAHFGGLVGVRIASLVIALVIALITYRIAIRQGYLWPGLALLFLLGQPIVFLHSFSELTELPFALLLALGFWAYQGRKWFWVATIAAFLPTARPEGFGFLILAAMALVLHKRLRFAPLLIVPLIAWSVAGWYYDLCPQPWYTHIPRWLPRNWPYSSESVYGRGFILRYVILLPAILSPVAFPAMALGVWQSLSFRKNTKHVLDACWDSIFGDDHRLRVQWLIAIIPLAILAVHSLLYWAGRMASSGELRYITVAAPMWALLAAKGWEWMFVRLNWRRPFLWAGFALLLPALANVAYTVVPLKMDLDWQRGQQVIDWYRDSPFAKDYPLVIAPHPAVKYYQGVSPTDPAITPQWNHETAKHPPNGAVFVWDPMYANYNSDANRIVGLAEIEKAGWVKVRTLANIYSDPPKPGRGAWMMYYVKRPILKLFGREAREPIQAEPQIVLGEWYVFLSPKDSAGHATRLTSEIKP